MLILTRKVEQSVRIGPDITVTVLKLNAGRVTFGIEAPRAVRVDRDEVLERKDVE